MLSINRSENWNYLKNYNVKPIKMGKGGNGSVYLIRRENKSQRSNTNNIFSEYIIKFLLQKQDGAFLPMEISYAGQLNYRYFVKVLGWSYQEDITLPDDVTVNNRTFKAGKPCLGIAFEYIKNKDLDNSFKTEDFFNKEKHDTVGFVQKITSILCHMVCALKYLHDRNIIHRDIKPQNMYEINENGETHYKLGDFGVSFYVPGENDDNLTDSISGSRFISIFIFFFLSFFLFFYKYLFIYLL